MSEKLTLSEIAEKLDLTVSTIHNYIKSGKLKASKKIRGLGFKYMVKPSDLSEFMTKYM